MPNTLNQPESASPAPQLAAEMPPTPGLTIVVAVVVVAALYYGRGVLIPRPVCFPQALTEALRSKLFSVELASWRPKSRAS